MILAAALVLVACGGDVSPVSDGGAPDTGGGTPHCEGVEPGQPARCAPDYNALCYNAAPRPGDPMDFQPAVCDADGVASCSLLPDRMPGDPVCVIDPSRARDR